MSSLLSRKPQPGDDDSAAAGRLDREGVGDDHAVVVGDGQVGRRLALAIDVDASAAGSVRPAARLDQPVSASAACSVISARRSRGVGVGEQAVERHAEEVGVGEVGAAVGVGVARRLEEAVERLGASWRRAARSPRGCSGSRRRSSRRSTAAPCPRRRGRGSRRGSGADPGRCSAARSSRGQQARAPHVVGVGHRRRLRRGGHRRRHSALVEPVGAEPGDAPVGAREAGVAQRRADVARRPVGVEVERGGRRDVVEVLDVVVDLVVEGLVDAKAIARRVDPVA